MININQKKSLISQVQSQHYQIRRLLLSPPQQLLAEPILFDQCYFHYYRLGTSGKTDSNS